jgi:hypothetical protein
MARTARILLTVALLGAVQALQSARAQTQPAQPGAAAPPAQPATGTPRPSSANLPSALPSLLEADPESEWQPELLRTLPRPPDQPRSLFQAAQPLGQPPPDLEWPYFWRGDPILDSPEWPHPGWFYNVQIGVIRPHVVNEQNNFDHPIMTRSGKTANLQLGNASMSETISPRIELGYRLPSGFGQLSVADRFFTSSGTGPYNTSSGTGTRSSILSVNYTDFDYGSWEYTPWKNWSMMWVAGVRQEETFNRTRVSLPFAQAAAGRGIYAAQSSNATAGAGMHFAVLLQRKFADSGFSLINRFDVGDTFSQVHQYFSANFTTSNANGRPEAGFVKEAVWMQIPMVNYIVGIGYQPPSHPNVRLFAGYMLDAWWNVMRRTGTSSNGNFTDQGAILGAGINY